MRTDPRIRLINGLNYFNKITCPSTMKKKSPITYIPKIIAHIKVKIISILIFHMNRSENKWKIN